MVGEQGGSLHNVTLDVRGSDCVIKGVAMSGFGPVAQIFIGGKEPQVMRNLIIDDITVTHANYAILRRDFITKWMARGLRIAALAIYRGTPLSGMSRFTTATS